MKKGSVQVVALCTGKKGSTSNVANSLWTLQRSDQSTDRWIKNPHEYEHEDHDEDGESDEDEAEDEDKDEDGNEDEG